MCLTLAVHRGRSRRSRHFVVGLQPSETSKALQVVKEHQTSRRCSAQFDSDHGNDSSNERLGNNVLIDDPYSLDGGGPQ